MSEYLDNIKIGDEVYVACYSSTGASSEGNQTVANIETKYDGGTGKAFHIICIGNHLFDGRNGSAINAPTMYYIQDRE